MRTRFTALRQATSEVQCKDMGKGCESLNCPRFKLQTFIGCHLGRPAVCYEPDHRPTDELWTAGSVSLQHELSSNLTSPKDKTVI